MAKKNERPNNPQLQPYPRNQSFLDDQQLIPHSHTIPLDELRQLILSAIEKANSKSAREIISIPADISEAEIHQIFRKRAWDLFKYFQDYPGDPASTAHQLYGKHCREIAQELFRTRTLQMERMNSAWRYQYLVVDCASRSRRFEQISDRGTKEADFIGVIRFVNAGKAEDQVNLYVSVKNREDTIGGPDWPKSITELESYASSDKNRIGPYCCIFGIVMQNGQRKMKRRKSGEIYSWNTEVWLSDYFWPFFTNYSYAEIMKHVVDILVNAGYQPDKLSAQVRLPDIFLDAFENYCKHFELVNADGIFEDLYKLVDFFCGPSVRKPR